MGPHIHPIHTVSFSCPKRIDLLTYTPSPLTIRTASFSCPKRINLPTYTPSQLTIHTASFSCPNQRQCPHMYSAFPLLPPYKHSAWAWSSWRCLLSFGNVIFGRRPASNALRAYSANQRCQLFVMSSFCVTMVMIIV